jgi:glucosamine--fructose-6-phosphate aminotransferase (isomerizing)
MKQMRDKLAALKAETLVITDRSNPEAAKGEARVVVLPAKLAARGPLPADVFTPIPYIIPAQLFAAHLAAEKGLDPDQPRTLTKVTRTL